MSNDMSASEMFEAVLDRYESEVKRAEGYDRAKRDLEKELRTALADVKERDQQVAQLKHDLSIADIAITTLRAQLEAYEVPPEPVF